MCFCGQTSRNKCIGAQLKFKTVLFRCHYLLNVLVVVGGGGIFYYLSLFFSFMISESTHSGNARENNVCR